MFHRFLRFPGWMLLVINHQDLSPAFPVSPVTPFAIHSTNSLLSSLEMRHAIHIQQPRMIQLRNNPTWCTTSQLHTATTLRPHSSQSVASDQWPTQVAPWNQRTRVSLFFHICPMYQGAWDYYDFRIGTGCHQNHHASQWAPSLHIAGTVSSLAFSSGATGNHLVKPRPQHFTSMLFGCSGSKILHVAKK